MANTFAFGITVPANEIITSALGTNSGAATSATDVGKAVKLSTANNHILATGGDEIDGFINSVEPVKVNGGYNLGGVLIEGRIEALVGANQGGTPMAVGDYVVADTQAAFGTAGVAKVKTGTPAHKFWRCIRIVSGTGVAGDTVLLERT